MIQQLAALVRYSEISSLIAGGVGAGFWQNFMILTNMLDKPAPTNFLLSPAPTVACTSPTCKPL